MARRAKNESAYREAVCEECGYDFFHLPVEGMMAKPPFAVCGKCGHQQTVSPGDVMKNEDAKKSAVSIGKKR